MSIKAQDKLAEYKNILKKIKSYNEAVNVMYWDLRSGAPKKSIEGRSEVIGMLSSEVFKLMTSDEMGELTELLLSPKYKKQLDKLSVKSILESKKEYDRNKMIPQDMYQEYVVLVSKAEAVWEEAREKADYKLFKPYLKQIITYNREFTDLWGYTGNRYNALLDQYETGMTVELLDPIFANLSKSLVPLLKKVMAAEPVNSKFLRKQYDVEKQREYSLFLLKQMGYDFNAGRLDSTVHPFQTTLNHGDVRVLTRFEETDLSMSIFSTLHEGGHAQYEQNMDEELEALLLHEGSSMGIHESQSRFWENIIGRSAAFWEFYYKDLVALFPEQLGNVSKMDFYRGVNEIKPSPIRIEADELTYNFHIILRYELEKALINDELTVDDLPAAWNEKMMEYLGIEPRDDREGVLQDVHWSDGLFGYFPTYALGNIYSAQFYHKMKEELPEIKDMLKHGNLIPIKAWLNEKIHQYGKTKTPNQLLKEVTGEKLNAKYLIQYFNEKIKDIYEI